MNTGESKVFSLAELAEKYPRQWFAASVVERESESGQPLKVKIIARELDIFAIRRNVHLDDYCTFYTGPIPETMHVMML